MKIVVLTNKGCHFGKKILNACIQKKIALAGVVLIDQPLNYHWKLLKYVYTRVGVLDTCYFSIKHIVTPSPKEHDPFIHQYSKMPFDFHTSRGTNSQETQQALERLSPDILILGQTGIIRSQILSIPRIGTLNTHPGILPYYRGIDCAKWAIHNEDFDKIGSTVHWVDAGVDTGPILQTMFYTLKSNDTLIQLDNTLHDLSVTNLIDILLSLNSEPQPAAQAQDIQTGQQFYKMPRHLEKQTRLKLNEYLQNMTRV